MCERNGERKWEKQEGGGDEGVPEVSRGRGREKERSERDREGWQGMPPRGWDSEGWLGSPAYRSRVAMRSTSPSDERMCDTTTLLRHSLPLALPPDCSLPLAALRRRCATLYTPPFRPRSPCTAAFLHGSRLFQAQPRSFPLLLFSPTFISGPVLDLPTAPTFLYFHGGHLLSGKNDFAGRPLFVRSSMILGSSFQRDGFSARDELIRTVAR